MLRLFKCRDNKQTDETAIAELVEMVSAEMEFNRHYYDNEPLYVYRDMVIYGLTEKIKNKKGPK